MSRRLRDRVVPILLTLALFLGWTVTGVVHHHADQPGCELCKAMSNGAADLARPSGAPLPALTRESVAAIAANPLADRPLPHQRGRAPPSA